MGLWRECKSEVRQWDAPVGSLTWWGLFRVPPCREGTVRSDCTINGQPRILRTAEGA